MDLCATVGPELDQLLPIFVMTVAITHYNKQLAVCFESVENRGSGMDQFQCVIVVSVVLVHDGPVLSSISCCYMSICNNHPYTSQLQVLLILLITNLELLLV